MLGHDQQDAFRFLPVDNPLIMLVVLILLQGPVLYQFGAKGSVWAYNRFMDAILMCLRLLFIISVGHCVDDRNGAKPTESATGAFQTTANAFILLKWPMQKGEGRHASRLGCASGHSGDRIRRDPRYRPET